MRAVSTSLGSEEVSWTSAGMICGSPVDGRLFLTGREKPDGVGSKE